MHDSVFLGISLITLLIITINPGGIVFKRHCLNCNERLDTLGRSIAAKQYPELGNPYICAETGKNHEER